MTDFALDVAESMYLDGVDVLVVLHDVGFIDLTDGRYLIHDWPEYVGRILERRAKDAERKRADRTKTSEGHPKDILRTSTAVRDVSSIRGQDRTGEDRTGEEEGGSVEPAAPTTAESPILKIVSETCRGSDRCQEGRHPPIVRLRSIICDFPDMDIPACARSWSHWVRFIRPKSQPVKDAWGSLRKWIDRDHGDGKNLKTPSNGSGSATNPRGPTPFKSAADHLRDEMGVK